MKQGPIFALLAAGALFGWFSPDVAERSSDASAAGLAEAARERPDRLAVVQHEQWMAGEVVLPRAADGHFYADITVDGSTANMLVDTGASVVALTGEDAEAMGIYWDEAAIKPVASGASGAVHGVHVTLESVQLDGLEAHGVEAIVVPEGLGISLLGQSFLSKIQRVEIDQDKMVLGG